MKTENQKTNNYLNEICAKVKNKAVHPEIKKELESHINELALYYQKQGNSEEKSIELALKNLGDTKKLGDDLNKVHRKTFDFRLFITIIVLVFIGLVGSFSFNTPSIFHNSTSPLSNPYFFKNLIWVVIGGIAFIIGYLLKFKTLKKLSIPMYILGVVLYILYLFNPYTGHGQYYGFVLGPLSLSLLPLLPLLFLFGISGIYSKLNFKNKKYIIITLILGLAPLTCMSYTLKFIPMFIYYSLAFLIIMYIYSKNLKIIAISFILEIIIFCATSISGLKALIHSNLGSPNLVHQILATSKFIGKSSLSMTYINLSYSLTSAIAYFGFAFGILIVLILAYFIFRLIKLSLSINNVYGKSLSFAITSILAIETIWGVLMNLGIIPYAGVTIPFITYSGSFFMFGLFILGLLLNIYKLKTLKTV
ncbi:MAG: FtsW/RodA/SpoVE family cell cycle protein [Sarcina sp.]